MTKNTVSNIDEYLRERPLGPTFFSISLSLCLSVARLHSGVAWVKLPARSPNWNAQAGRFVRTIKESCLERMILSGERVVRKATAEFKAPYRSERNRQRNHQGLDHALICLEPEHAGGEGQVHRRNVSAGC